jgi:hypothetical protein
MIVGGAWRQRLSVLALAVLPLGLTAGCQTGSRGAQKAEAPADREAIISLFEQADALEIYTTAWPGEEEDEERLLATVLHSDDPARWAALADSLRRAGPSRRHMGISILGLRLRAGDVIVADGSAYPPVGDVCLRAAGAASGVRFTVGSPFNDLLVPHHERVTQATAAGCSGPPPAPEEEPAPIPTFEEVKARMVDFFRGCVYINVRAPGENSMGVDVRQEARREWQMMTKAVENAEEGLAIPGAPEILILCEMPDASNRLIELYYVGGMLGGADRELGENVRTLRPSPEFKKGLDSILAMARARRRLEESSGSR